MDQVYKKPHLVIPLATIQEWKIERTVNEYKRIIFSILSHKTKIPVKTLEETFNDIIADNIHWISYTILEAFKNKNAHKKILDDTLEKIWVTLSLWFNKDGTIKTWYNSNYIWIGTGDDLRSLWQEWWLKTEMLVNKSAYTKFWRSFSRKDAERLWFVPPKNFITAIKILGWNTGARSSMRHIVYNIAYIESLLGNTMYTWDTFEWYNVTAYEDNYISIGKGDDLRSLWKSWVLKPEMLINKSAYTKFWQSFSHKEAVKVWFIPPKSLTTTIKLLGGQPTSRHNINTGSLYTVEYIEALLQDIPYIWKEFNKKNFSNYPTALKEQLQQLYMDWILTVEHLSNRHVYTEYRDNFAIQYVKQYWFILPTSVSQLMRILGASLANWSIEYKKSLLMWVNLPKQTRKNKLEKEGNVQEWYSKVKELINTNVIPIEICKSTSYYQSFATNRNLSANAKEYKIGFPHSYYTFIKYIWFSGKFSYEKLAKHITWKENIDIKSPQAKNIINLYNQKILHNGLCGSQKYQDFASERNNTHNEEEKIPKNIIDLLHAFWHKMNTTMINQDAIIALIRWEYYNSNKLEKIIKFYATWQMPKSTDTGPARQNWYFDFAKRINESNTLWFYLPVSYSWLLNTVAPKKKWAWKADSPISHTILFKHLERVRKQMWIPMKK